MSRLLLFLGHFLPYHWWIALLTAAARLRCSLKGWMGETYGWIWDRDNATFDRDACRRLLDGDLLPAFEEAAHDLPQLYKVDQRLALVVIETPECEPMHRLVFDFLLERLDTAKEKVADFLLSLTPMNLRRGSQIRFVVASVAELTLAGFVYERMMVLRTIE